jgi:hypothetical protein
MFVTNMLEERRSFGGVTFAGTDPAEEQDLFDALVA